MPPIKAAIDNPTFARIFTINETYWLFSSKLLESSARKDIVVNDPENPTAAKREYLLSRCHYCESTMNNPRINDPITEPIPRKINSRPFVHYKIMIRDY